MPRWNRGAYLNGERTFNHLLYSANYKAILQQYATDDDLPVKFTYPWTGNRFQPGRVVIPKGHIVALRADRNYQRENMEGRMLPCLTICNGGVVQNISRDYGGTYVQAANTPIGITLNNVYKTVDGTFDFGFPTVAYEAHIEIPYFGSNAALAQAMNWPCAYDAGGSSISNGGYVKSDGDGKFVPWVAGDSEAQKVGRVTIVDRHLPDSLLAWVMLEVVDAMAGFGITPDDLRSPLYNPYTVIDPSPLSDTQAGDTTFGSRSGDLRTDYRKPYNYYPYAVSYEEGESKYLLDQKQIFQLLGLPGLHDGIARGAAEVSESYSAADASHFSYNAATGVTTLSLAHGMIQRDDEGCIHPSSAHPFPSKLALYNNAAPTVRLQENVDYKVLRQSGKVIIPGTNGTETWNIVYTHLENVVAGIPSNLNYAGVVGAARIMINTYK